MVIRIEDTDVQRSTAASERAVLEDLRWLGIDWDEGPDVGGIYGPYRQSERRWLYRQEADRLLARGAPILASAPTRSWRRGRAAAQAAGLSPHYDGTCRDLSEAERASGGPRAGRRASASGWVTDPVEVRDLIRGAVIFPPEVVGDFVILRSNGLPTYNYACVVDDAAMKITDVLRGEEHLSNTPAAGAALPRARPRRARFGHISLILNPDRSKMSKRSGEAATFVGEFRAQGYLPEALVNFLALLGWSWDGATEVFSRAELVEKFSLERVNPSAAVFDRTKLLAMNSQYLRALRCRSAPARVRAFLEAGGRLPPGRTRTASSSARWRRPASGSGPSPTSRPTPTSRSARASRWIRRARRGAGQAGARERLAALAELAQRTEPFTPAALEAGARPWPSASRSSQGTSSSRHGWR